MIIVIPILVSTGELKVERDSLVPCFGKLLPYKMEKAQVMDNSVIGVSWNNHNLAVVEKNFSGKVAKLLGNEIVVIERMPNEDIRVSTYEGDKALPIEHTTLDEWKKKHPNTEIY